jgi:hypothetical protein
MEEICQEVDHSATHDSPREHLMSHQLWYQHVMMDEGMHGLLSGAIIIGAIVVATIGGTGGWCTSGWDGKGDGSGK